MTASRPRFVWLKNNLWTLGALVLAVFALSTCIGASPLEGAPAPLFTAPLLAGGSVDLRDHVGKEVIVLNFWATWCPPCQEEMPALAELAESMAEKPVRFLAVNDGESPQQAAAFLKQAGIEMPVVLNSSREITHQYQVVSLPMTFIIDHEGIVRHVYPGYARGMEEEIRERVLELLPSSGAAPEGEEA